MGFDRGPLCGGSGPRPKLVGSAAGGRSGTAGASCGRAVVDGRAGVGERVLDHPAEEEDDGDDQGRDAGHEEAVLDGGGPSLVTVDATGLEEVTQVLHGES